VTDAGGGPRQEVHPEICSPVPTAMVNQFMSDHIEKKIELVGLLQLGIEDAITKRSHAS